MPNKRAFNAVMATPAATMRHSPAFDIMGFGLNRYAVFGDMSINCNPTFAD
jgi:hypothetical protein